MLKSSVTIDEALKLLNELALLDNAAVTELIQHRVPCNRHLADHPTVQVGGDEVIAKVGVLGIINGLFGVNADGWGAIGARMVEDADGFQHVDCFIRVKPVTDRD